MDKEPKSGTLIISTKSEPIAISPSTTPVDKNVSPQLIRKVRSRSFGILFTTEPDVFLSSKPSTKKISPRANVSPRSNKNIDFFEFAFSDSFPNSSLLSDHHDDNKSAITWDKLNHSFRSYVAEKIIIEFMDSYTLYSNTSEYKPVNIGDLFSYIQTKKNTTENNDHSFSLDLIEKTLQHIYPVIDNNLRADLTK